MTKGKVGKVQCSGDNDEKHNSWTELREDSQSDKGEETIKDKISETRQKS